MWGELGRSDDRLRRERRESTDRRRRLVLGSPSTAGINVFRVSSGSACLGALALAVRFKTVSIRFNDHEIVSTTPWSGTKHLRWEDVTHVTYSQVNRWFIFSSGTETKIRVHYLLGGLTEFLREAQRRLPERTIAPALDGLRTHDALDETRIPVRTPEGELFEISRQTFKDHVLAPKIAEVWNAFWSST